MKKLCCSFLIFLLLLSFPCCNTKNNKKITVALEENLYPYCYFSNEEYGEASAQNGKFISGIYITFAKKIFQMSGYNNIDFIVCPYNEFADKIKSGETDIFITKRKFKDSEIEKSHAFYYSDLGIMIKPESDLEKSLMSGKLESDKITILSDSTEKSFDFPTSVAISDSIPKVLKSFSSEDGFRGVICDFQTSRAIKILSSTELKYISANLLSLKGEDVCHNFYMKKNSSSLIKSINNAIDKISVDDMYEITEKEIKVFKELKKKKIF